MVRREAVRACAESQLAQDSFYTLKMVLSGAALSLAWGTFVHCAHEAGMPLSLVVQDVLTRAGACSPAARHTDGRVWRPLRHQRCWQQGMQCTLDSMGRRSQADRARPVQVVVGEDNRKRMYFMDAGNNLYYDSGNPEVGWFQVGLQALSVLAGWL